MAKRIPPGVGPKYPQVVVLVGATGDLSKRKLLPGLFHLASAGFIPGCRIIGVSLDDIDADAFRTLARAALDEFSSRPVDELAWVGFAEALDYVSLASGAKTLKAAVEKAEQSLGVECQRIHYLSVSAGGGAVRRAPSGRGGVGRTRPHHHGEAVRHRSCQRRFAQCETA